MPSLFSFNSPIGACETCRGFGRTIGIDYDLVIPDDTKTLAGGAVKPWQTESYRECQDDLMEFAGKPFPEGRIPTGRVLPQSRRFIDELMHPATSGRNVSDCPFSLAARDRSSHVYISFATISVSSPTPRANSSVDSKIGVRISWKL